MTDPLAALTMAVGFAAQRHGMQSRKGGRGLPYFTHLAEVAGSVAKAGGDAIAATGASGLALLQAAYLHDVVEDGHATEAEIAGLFGPDVAALVAELTDPPGLPDDERKQRQVDHVAQMSRAARLIKLADKTSNLREMADDPPADWPPEKRRAYVDWGVAVVDAGCRGIAPALEAEFDGAVADARRRASA
ncbi:HD domain-containing protein [Faunimonas sp. B44]|uniref:HD domain-containing protein n=1 Tax=Faunimonas sp. B44 TaxID=3461493 RepID=UPI0040445DCC